MGSLLTLLSLNPFVTACSRTGVTTLQQHQPPLSVAPHTPHIPHTPPPVPPATPSTRERPHPPPPQCTELLPEEEDRQWSRREGGMGMLRVLGEEWCKDRCQWECHMNLRGLSTASGHWSHRCVCLGKGKKDDL